MKENIFVKNAVIDKLCGKFLTEYEKEYNNINADGKECLIKHITAFFRRWYYSTLVENTDISPALIAEFGSNEKSIYPVINCSSHNDFKYISINNMRFGLDQHPLCIDYRILIEFFKNGVALNDRLEMDFEDIKKLEGVSSFDSDYITYVTMLGIDMGYIEKMPSVGVDIYCSSKKSQKIYDMGNEELLRALFEKAVDIASSYLSDEFMGESHFVPDGIIMSWIATTPTVDEIFTDAYGEFSIEISEGTSVEEMNEMQKALTAKAYTRGINLDKWFLTPFSYYFRLIEPIYMYEFSYTDEMLFLINAVKTNETINDETVIDSALYAPCTKYKLSKLGKEFFGAVYDDNPPYLFENMNIDEIIDSATAATDDGKIRILDLYEPEYNVCTIRLSLKNEENLWIDIQLKESTTLDDLHMYIMNLFRSQVIICQGYRFYKLPESPFTEYTPPFMDTRGPHTNDNTISSVLEIGENFFYDLFTLDAFNDEDEDTEGLTINIEFINISKREKGVIYPKVIGFSPEAEKIRQKK